MTASRCVERGGKRRHWDACLRVGFAWLCCGSAYLALWLLSAP